MVDKGNKKAKFSIQPADRKRLKFKGTRTILLCSGITEEELKFFATKVLGRLHPDSIIEYICVTRPFFGSADSLEESIEYKRLKECKNPKAYIRIYLVGKSLSSALSDPMQIIKSVKNESLLYKHIWINSWSALILKFRVVSPDLNIIDQEDEPEGDNQDPQDPINNYILRTSHPIDSLELSQWSRSSSLRKYLIARTKLLDVPKQKSWIGKINLFDRDIKQRHGIIESPSKQLLTTEIDPLIPELIFEKYRYYIADFKQIPNVMIEISRLRELTFRQINEGSGNAIDMDEYDLFYRHAFIWDSEESCIIGAYRIGEGHHIFPLLGKKGFYISTLFKMDDKFNEVLVQSVELGRAFMIKEFQKSNMLFLLMWKAIFRYIQKNPANKYVLGPVSISEDYSKISRILIIDYLKTHYSHPEFIKWIKPRKLFRVHTHRSSKKMIIKNFNKDLQEMDRLISEVQFNSFRMPVLIKQYLKQNAKLLGFNLDPQFQNVLDVLLILELSTIPANFTELLLNDKSADDKQEIYTSNAQEGSEKIEDK